MTGDALRGVWVAMPTPFAADDTVDGSMVRNLVERYAAAGLHGAYTTGTDGEMHVLDLPDFERLAAAFGQATRDVGLPAQMGCTWSHTPGVIERGRIAAQHGIDVIQIALPSWVPLSAGEMVAFFAEVQAALPETRFVHYNIARAGRFLTGADYQAVLDVAPNLIGSKHTGGDVASLIDIVQATPTLAHFVVDGQIVPGKLFGARGFYSFIANLSPALALNLWSCVDAGEWEAAARLRERIDAFFRQWRTSWGEVTASPALGKIATAAGLEPALPLAVRKPYRSGTAADVSHTRDLFTRMFPEFAPAS